VRARLDGREYRFAVKVGRLPDSPVEIFLLANDRLFGRAGLYQEAGKDYPDNLERFAAFSRAVLELPALLRWRPDMLHANDWQTALTLVYLRSGGLGSGGQPPASLFTIHNIGYMGLFPGNAFPALGLPEEFFTPDTLEFYGQINLLKGGLVFGTLLNTVSPTYAREIQTGEFGHGLDGVLRHRRSDLFGVVNGVDYTQWNPATDLHLPRRYNAAAMDGKLTCKRILQRERGLPESDAPLFGMITRLAAQKGVDLVLEALESMMRLDLQLVVLGTGEPALHAALEAAAARYPKKLSVILGFDDALAHRIEAGADLFLMPSRYEPCGLNQLYSLRYGTIPIVRRTGGLADTVVHASPAALADGTATGIQFDDASGPALLDAVRAALTLYADRARWSKMVAAAMAADFSWDRSAKDYVGLYSAALERARPAA